MRMNAQRSLLARFALESEWILISSDWTALLRHVSPYRMPHAANGELAEDYVRTLTRGGPGVCVRERERIDDDDDDGDANGNGN